jgi:purine-binding chemotaxis protein CheW
MTESGAPSFLSFAVGDQLCAIAMDAVREIVRWQPLTRLPESLPVVAGVMNLRGQGILVLDLASRLGLTAAPISARTCVVVLEIAAPSGDRPVGLQVDSANQLLELQAPVVGKPSEAAGIARPDLLAGVLSAEGRQLLVLDLPRILALDEPPAPRRQRRAA